MVAIGVTGHRKLENVEQISSGVDEAICKIIESFTKENLVIVSSLAEGADRLLVWRAMENNVVHLIVPLPLEISDYMLDFNSTYSKAEFVTLLEQAAQVIELPAEETREASYLSAGLYVLDHSDVLIAVWDGQPSGGLGGTAQIVTEARERQIPIAWVFAWNQEGSPPSPSSTSEIQGEVRYENFP